MDPSSPENELLELAVQVMRGILRYRNAGATRIFAILLNTLDECSAMLQADIDTLASMVMVDPDFQGMWNARMAKRREILSEVRAVSALVRSAMVKASQQIEKEKEAHGK